MTVFKKLAAFLLAIAVAGLSSGVAWAADKHYTVTMTASPGTSPSTVTATFTNSGNSSFNSLTLALPTTGGYAFAPGATVTASRGNASIVAGGIKVTDINLPTGAGQSMSVTINGVVAGGTTCGSGSTGTWSAVLWTGSQLTGNNFTRDGAAPTTTISPLCYTISTSVSGNGTISPTSATVSAGATKAFTLTPGTGSAIDSASGCGGSLSGSTFTTGAITGNCTVSASFKLLTYTLTYLAGSGGTISGTNPQTVSYGFDGSTVTATPSDNYRFDKWNDDKTSASRQETNVTSSQTYTASFKANTISISGAPSIVGAGQVFPITVTLDGPPGSVDVTVTGAGCSLVQPTSSVAVSGSAVINVAIAQTQPPADQLGCQLKVSASNFQTATYSFAKVYAGVLGCTNGTNYDSTKGKTNYDLDPDQDIAYIDTPGWGLRRGQNNDGVDCQQVNYSLTVNSNNTSVLLYDKTGPTPPQPNGAFKYVIVWNPVNPDANGWSQKRPKVAWGPSMTNPSSGDYVPALFCTSDGTTPTKSNFADLTAAELLALLPTIPLNDPDYLAAYNSGARPQYNPDGTTKAKMCIAQQGVTPIGVDSNGKILLQFWTKVIDQGDGWMSID